MEKLLIVDGSGLLFQSFYGMPKQIKNSSGQRVEAVICFLGILFKQLKTLSPDKLLIVFDGETHLQRKDDNPEYKANRMDFSNMPPEDTPFEQLKIIQTVLDKLNFSFLETTTHEADDIIASVANEYKNNYNIIISSADKDFYQLIESNVSVYTYRGKASTLCTPQKIIEKFGFEPKYFATFKCLSGDPSDNIKGVPGIGTKTAAKLIKEHGDIFDIIDFAEKLQNPGKIYSKIVQNKQLLIKNYKIIELFSKRELYELKNSQFTLPQGSSIDLLKQLQIL